MKIELDIRDFENTFEEKFLKKGLLLFEKNKVEESGISNRTHSFIVSSQPPQHIEINKRGHKLIKFQCTCGNMHPCEHLSAVLFHINFKDHLPRSTKKIRIKISKDRLLIEFDDLLKKLNREIKEQLKIGNTKVSNENADELLTKLLKANSTSDWLMLQLVLLVAFTGHLRFKIFSFQQESNVLTRLANELGGHKIKELTQKNKKHWLYALQLCCLNKRRINAGTYLFLLPYVLQFKEAELLLDELKTAIEKNSQKKVYPNSLDEIKIAIFEIEIAQQISVKGSFKGFLHPTPESSIAIAEFYLARRKEKKVLEGLKNDLKLFSESKPSNYVPFVEYVQNKAMLFKNKELEMEAIEQIFLSTVGGKEGLIRRIGILLSDRTQRDLFFDRIIRHYKKLPEIFFYDLAQLLESEERYDELIKEIEKQNDKFMLLNRIAIKKLPEYNSALHKVYKKQLINILYSARESFHQKQIFEASKLYLNKLPKKVSIQLLKELLEQISRNNFIYDQLREYKAELESSLQD